jgi:hypothetical protein
MANLARARPFAAHLRMTDRANAPVCLNGPWSIWSRERTGLACGCFRMRHPTVGPRRANATRLHGVTRRLARRSFSGRSFPPQRVDAPITRLRFGEAGEQLVG